MLGILATFEPEWEAGSRTIGKPVLAILSWLRRFVHPVARALRANLECEEVRRIYKLVHATSSCFIDDTIEGFQGSECPWVFCLAGPRYAKGGRCVSEGLAGLMRCPGRRHALLSRPSAGLVLYFDHECVADTMRLAPEDHFWRQHFDFSWSSEFDSPPVDVDADSVWGNDAPEFLPPPESCPRWDRAFGLVKSTTEANVCWADLIAELSPVQTLSASETIERLDCDPSLRGGTKRPAPPSHRVPQLCRTYVDAVWEFRKARDRLVDGCLDAVSVELLSDERVKICVLCGDFDGTHFYHLQEMNNALITLGWRAWSHCVSGDLMDARKYKHCLSIELHKAGLQPSAENPAHPFYWKACTSDREAACLRSGADGPWLMRGHNGCGVQDQPEYCYGIVIECRKMEVVFHIFAHYLFLILIGFGEGLFVEISWRFRLIFGIVGR